MTERPKSIYDYPAIYERVGLRLGHFGCIMLDLEPIYVTDMLGPGIGYYYAEDPLLRYVQGPVAEKIAHATLLYGLTPGDNAGIDQKESVDELLAGLDLSEVTVESIGSFPSQQPEKHPYSCIVAHLSTDGDLGEANRRLRFLPHIDSFMNYRPHMTLAYVPINDQQKAIERASSALDGATLYATGINYGGEMK